MKTEALCILCSLLLVAVAGCDRSAPPSVMQESPSELDVAYEQLLRKRLAVEEKVVEAMALYRTTNRKVREQRTQLWKYLEEASVSDSEAIELFGQSRSNDIEIPLNLRVAYSCWQTLLPDATLRLKVTDWLDRQQTSYILEELDVKIKEIENYRQLGKILDQADQREIDRLLALSLTDWNAASDVNNAIYEQQVIESLKADWGDAK